MLLQSALDLFVERGYDRTTCESVAVRAGVSKGTLFLYFPDKQALFRSVCRHDLERPALEGQGMLEASAGSSTEVLSHLYRLWWSHLGDGRAGRIAKLLFTDAGSFPELTSEFVDLVINASVHQLAEVIRHGIRAGTFRHVQAEAAARAMVSVTVSRALVLNSLGAQSAAEATAANIGVADDHVDAFLEGLLIDKASSPIGSEADSPWPDIGASHKRVQQRSGLVPGRMLATTRNLGD